MTYLLPDDWYANHGLAPGDALLPQSNLAPRPGNLQPTPPIRGYFGPRPPVPSLAPSRGETVSPYAVSDVMWGVHGLGDEGQTQAIIDENNRKLKQEMMAAAATRASIGIGLAFIPVVGWAVGLVMSVITTISVAHYKQAATRVMAGLQDNLARLSASYDAKLQAVQGRVFDQEKGAAIQLAVSGTPLNGLGAGHWFDYIINPVKQTQFIFKAVAQPVHVLEQSVVKRLPAPAARILAKVDANTYGQVTKAIGKGFQVTDALTGEDALNRTRVAADRAMVSARAEMEKQYQAAVTNVTSPAYRSSLRTVIAQRIRQDPNIANLITERLAIQVQAASAAGSDTAPLVTAAKALPPTSVVPGAIAAAAVLAIGFFTRK